jgi:hypothetical protein
MPKCGHIDSSMSEVTEVIERTTEESESTETGHTDMEENHVVEVDSSEDILPPAPVWESECPPEYEDTEPVYTVISHINKSRLAPGDEVHVKMYVIGYGEVEKNRLNINYSTDELLDDSYDNFVRANMVTVRNQQTGHEVPLSTEERRNDNKVSIEKGESGGRFVGLTESFFRPDAWQQEYRNPTLQPTAAGTDRPLWDEQMVTENVPPIEVKLKTSENLTPGVHKLFTTLTYTWENGIKQDRQEVEVYILNRYERHQTALSLAGIWATSFIIIASAFNLGPSLTLIIPVMLAMVFIATINMAGIVWPR